MNKLRIYSVLSKIDKDWSVKIKICCVCRRDIRVGNYKRSIFNVHALNDYHQDSYRYACTRCTKIFLRQHLKDVQYSLDRIPQYRKDLKQEIKETKELLEG